MNLMCLRYEIFDFKQEDLILCPTPRYAYALPKAFEIFYAFGILIDTLL